MERHGLVAVAQLVDPESALYKPLPWDEWKMRSERAYLIRTLCYCQGNISEAARVLSVERSTIHKWLKAYGIEKLHYLGY